MRTRASAVFTAWRAAIRPRWRVSARSTSFCSVPAPGTRRRRYSATIAIERGSVPAEVVGGADVVCRKCQEAAISDDAGSDDEVVPDDEETSVAALEDVSDADLLAEIARRMGDEEALAQEERKEPKDHRN